MVALQQNKNFFPQHVAVAILAESQVGQVTTLSRFYSLFYGFTPGFTLPLYPVFTELHLLTLLPMF